MRQRLPPAHRPVGRSPSASWAGWPATCSTWCAPAFPAGAWWCCALPDAWSRRSARQAGRWSPCRSAREHGLTASLRSLRRAVERVAPGRGALPPLLRRHRGRPRPRRDTSRWSRPSTASPPTTASTTAAAAKSAVMARVHRARLRRFDAVDRGLRGDPPRDGRQVAPATAGARRSPTAWTPCPARCAAEAGLRVLSLARLAPEKRLADLVAAFALVARDHDEATLTLAGVG